MVIRALILAALLSGGPFPAHAGGLLVKAKSSLPSSGKATVTYEKEVLPVLREYCYNCHGNGKKKGDIALDAYPTLQSILNDRGTWEKVLHNVRAHVMPPETKRQPTPEQRDLVAQWIESEIFPCDCQHPDPGRVTLRRLNRVEYNNTIRDLLGINFQPADDFPADDSGYGFDNIGDVLSLSPLLLEKYLAAAEKILDAAIVADDPSKVPVKRFDAENLEGSAPGEAREGGARLLAREGDIFVPFRFPYDGEYVLRARAYGEQAGPDPVRLTLRLATNDLKTFDVPVVATNPATYQVRVTVPAGTNRFAAAYINNYVNTKDPDPKKRGDRNLIIEYLEIEGPCNAGPRPLPATHTRIFFRQPTPTTKLDCARDILSRFAGRAYRRPLTTNEIGRLMEFFTMTSQRGETFEESIKLALATVLISPHFLFRGELQPDPNNPHSIHPIDEYALASRLSYFLWSSLPDDELLALAQRGALRKNLSAEVKRMLQDTKSSALIDNFAGQWLQLRNVKLATPDAKAFPNFDEPLRAAMETETEKFFEAILREDRSVLEFLDADYTFLNERLARHYGISGVIGDQFQRVSLKRHSQRGGILSQASILTLTSNPTRTSPVKRGKYVLENILGTPPPPPPPDVPELKEGAVLTGSLRQRMEQHRANSSCASCHARMDPIGFGFENFDGIGGWRQKDGDFPIDPAGQLVSGESFKGPAELRTILLKKKKNDFIRCLAEKMLTYALGRGLEYYDKCAVDQITKGLVKNRYRFSALILEVVNNAPFQMRRGEVGRSE